MKNKAILLTAALLLAFIVFGLLAPPWDMQSSLQDETATAQHEESDYYITGMVVDRFMPDGSHDYRMTAAQVTHFPQGDISELQMPELNWYEAGRVSWVMTADSGVLRPDQTSGADRLLLEDHVVANKISPDGKVLNITTTSLNVLPAEREATSEAPVEFKRGTMLLNGIGMHAWLTQDRIRLLSQVQGRYE